MPCLFRAKGRVDHERTRIKSLVVFITSQDQRQHELGSDVQYRHGCESCAHAHWDGICLAEVLRRAENSGVQEHGQIGRGLQGDHAPEQR